MSTKQKCQRGSALVTTMLVLVIGAVYVGTMFVAAEQRKFSEQTLGNSMKAQALAEGGAQQAYSILMTNFSLRTDSSQFPSTSYGGGSFDVDVSNPAAFSSNTAVLTVKGVYAGKTNYISMNVVNTNPAYTAANSGSGGSTSTYASGFAILSGGDMTFSRNGDWDCDTNKGRIHSCGKFYRTGSGDMKCKDFECEDNYEHSGSGSCHAKTMKIAGTCHHSGSGNIHCDDDFEANDVDSDDDGGEDCDNDVHYGHESHTGNGHCHSTYGHEYNNETISVQHCTIPTLDTTPYYNQALACGQVKTNYTYSGSTNLCIPGGVMYVCGTLTLSGSGGCTGGCFIATGKITHSGSGCFSNACNYPLFCSRDDDIDCSGSGNCRGLIHTRVGKCTKSGSGKVTGQIVCGGTFTASASWDTMVYTNYTPVAPGTSGSTTTTNVACISVWQQ